MFEKSGNPMFNEDRVRTQARTISVEGNAYMTKEGAINKSTILLGVMLLTSLFAYANPSPLAIWGGMIGGLALYFITMWKPHIAGITAPIYAAFEGLLVGGLSAIYGGMYEGLVFKAIMVTLSILFVMLILYRTGTIKVTQKFRSAIIAATGAIFLVYIVSIGLSFFDISIPFLHTGSPIGILISLAIIGIAAMNLLLDFDFIEKAAENNMPKHYEWYSGMALLATLVWIYIEVLRLLSVLARD
jgi:uncharacterized YccA/Bax inhibitor family protein